MMEIPEGYHSCLYCKGRGFVSNRSKNPYIYSSDLRNKAFYLRKQGLSYRKIADLLGIIYPQSAKNLVMQYEQDNQPL